MCLNCSKWIRVRYQKNLDSTFLNSIVSLLKAQNAPKEDANAKDFLGDSKLTPTHYMVHITTLEKYISARQRKHIYLKHCTAIKKNYVPCDSNWGPCDIPKS